MLFSDIPTQFQIPFANNAGAGFTRPIPVASQISIQAGAASLHDGYPPVTFLAIGAGGTPPFGKDMNGILNQISAWSRWQGAGAPVQFDGTLSTAIGGYPKGAVVQSSVISTLFWISTADNNTDNPDVTPTSWQPFTNNNARIVSASGAFTIARSDSSIGLNRTGTSSAVLPSDADFGQTFTIDDLGGNFFNNQVTISAPGGMTVNGIAGLVLASDWMSATFIRYDATRYKARFMA